MLPGFDYLKNRRKLSSDTIRDFHLAYCDKDGFIYADSKFPAPSLTIDYRFNHSVLFPISNVYNDLIGISARKLDYDTKKDLKYVNTVYPKTDHLYGLNVTYTYCFAARRVYIVEGNVDTLMMYQAGIKNVVGMLGSNISITQLSILSRFVDEITFVPDGDEAGQKMLSKLSDLRKSILNKYKNLDLSFSAVRLPNGYDPDKFLKEHTKEDFLKLEVVPFKI
jgi:DNA primase